MDRRTLLAVAGTTLLTASAGCNDSRDETTRDTNASENTTGVTNTSQNGTDETDPTENGTEDTNTSESDTEADTDESGRVPADVVREFYEAVDAGDPTALSSLLHDAVAGEVTDGDVVEADWELVSVATTVTEEDPDPGEVPITRLSADERAVVVRGEPTVLGTDGAERTLRPRRFVVATDDGRWQLWDLVVGFFHEPPQTLAIEGVTGVVGSPGEIHEVRLAVTPRPESGAVNLSRLQVVFLGPQKTNLYASSVDGEPATGESHPEDVSPTVFDRPDRPDDRYGVAVVEASQPDNITMTATADSYELVVDTSGGTTDAGVDRLSPLTPGDELGIVVMTQTGQQFDTTAAIPALDGAKIGDRVDISE